MKAFSTPPKSHCPFTITFGMVPSNYIPRLEEEKTIKDALAKEGSSFFISGVRGGGKTVLLTKISHELKEQGCLLVDLIPFDDIKRNLVLSLLDKGSSKGLLPKEEFAFLYEQGLSLEEKKLKFVFKKTLEILKEKDTRVLITMDEVCLDQSTKEFFLFLKPFLQESYPISLLLSGLAENYAELEETRDLSFLKRVPRLFIEPLDRALVASSYVSLLDIEESQAKKLASLSKGYAWAYQLLGYLICKYGFNQECRKKYYKVLCDTSFMPIWHNLPEREKRVLLLLNEGLKSKEIQKSLKLSDNQMKETKRILFERGTVFLSLKQEMRFALPGFRKSLNEYGCLEPLDC